jgi:predicted metal-dependent enzyme (double-stranded beta helix superfamily)
MAETNEEYYLDDARLRSFVETIDRTAAEHDEVPSLLSALREPFVDLLERDDWLPERYRTLPSPDDDNASDMGGDIAQWLLYRRAGALSISSLVVPPGVSTPVHDHLAWGLVGLCQGTQRETFYRRVDDGDADEGHAELAETEVQTAGPGDWYELIPPDGDIHDVTTTSDVPSVSIHVLGADIGCIPRHAFDLGDDRVELFQSGYTNVECEDDLADRGHAHAHAHDETL